MSNVTDKGFSNVINLSSVCLSQEQLGLLNKGLSFVPSVPVYRDNEAYFSTKYEVQQYHRRLKLAFFFKNSYSTERLPFLPQSTWTPSMYSLPTQLQKLITDDLEYFDYIHRFQKNKPNLTRKETEALKELIKNNNIVIKPDDKGSSVVILDRSQYLWEGYRQLEDKNYYIKLAQPIYPFTIPLVQEVINWLYKKIVLTLNKKHISLGCQNKERDGFIFSLKSTRTNQHGQNHRKYPRGDRSSRTVAAKPTEQLSILTIFCNHSLHAIPATSRTPTTFVIRYPPLKSQLMRCYSQWMLKAYTPTLTLLEAWKPLNIVL